MTGVRIEVKNRELLLALAQLARVGRSPAPALGVVGNDLVVSTQERIRAERSPEGGGWPALNPGYAATKRASGMLQASGALIRSLTSQVEGSTLRVGTNRIYAAIHQFGGTITAKEGKRLAFRLGKSQVFARSVTIPARPYLGISKEDQVEIIATLEDFTRRAMGG